MVVWPPRRQGRRPPSRTHRAMRFCEGKGAHTCESLEDRSAGRGVAVRRAEAGIRVTVAPRDAERAAQITIPVGAEVSVEVKGLEPSAYGLQSRRSSS